MMQGDCDLIPVQRYTDSIKHVLKQTMLNQDCMFRNQVHELHRLYRVQELLMKDFGWEECNYDSWNMRFQSSLLPFTNPFRYESPAKQPRFPSTSKVGWTPFADHELLKDCQGRRLLDLQLSADEFINLTKEDLPRKMISQNWFGGPTDFKLPLPEGNSSHVEELKLSLELGIGRDNGRMAGATSTCFSKRTYYCSQNAIDLEDSIENMPDDYAKCETSSKGKQELQGSASSDRIILTNSKKHLSHEIAESSSFQEYGESCQEQVSSSEGIRESNDAPSNDLSYKLQQLSSHRGLLDLNKVHSEDSCCSDNNMLAYPSRPSLEGASDGFHGSMQDGFFTTMFLNREDNKRSDEASEMLNQNDLVNRPLLDLNKNYTGRDISTINSKNYGIIDNEPSLASPESMLSHLGGISEDLDCCSGNDKIDSVGTKSKLYSEESCEKSEVENVNHSCTDKSQNSLQGDQCKSPDSCKPFCISDNDSSSAATTNSGITSGVLNKDLKTQIGYQVADVLAGENEQRTSDNSDLKCNREGESGEVDVLMEEAAESLIHILSQHSAYHQDSYAKMGSKENENERKVQPLCSFDSFELISINLTESNVDDNSVSSKPHEITDMEAKEFGLKLRRGRRMKDFQKEILPSLASLSRHEILEDVNIMEGVLRSREYRKMRGKMAGHGDNWTAPVKSRRSRHGYAGRK